MAGLPQRCGRQLATVDLRRAFADGRRRSDADGDDPGEPPARQRHAGPVWVSGSPVNGGPHDDSGRRLVCAALGLALLPTLAGAAETSARSGPPTASPSRIC